MTQSSYEQRRSIATYWRNKSNDLLGAAGLVWLGMSSNHGKEREALELPEWYSFEVACPSVFRMLCGMSMELLLKSIIVQQGNEPKHTHNLNELVGQACASVTSEDTQLLGVLTEYIVWDGRYPVPKTEPLFLKARELEREALITKVPLGSFTILRYNKALDWENFIGIWNKFNVIYLSASDSS